MLKLSLLLTALAALIVTKKVHAGEKSLYDFLWLDPDKKVYVLQNKIYKKEKTFYGDLGYLSNFTSKFQDTRGVAGRVGYFFDEDWGVELYYNQYMNSDNEDWRNVRKINSADPFVRRFKNTMGAMAIWSPFYGKINTFNQIFYLDWQFGLGLGKISAESNKSTVANQTLDSVYESESYTAVVWKTQLKFHLKENIHLGVEWMQHHYSAPGPKPPGGSVPSAKLRNNQDLIFSIGFSY